jgi:hypothetical protein
MKSSMRAALLCMAILLGGGCGAARRFETSGLDQACANECEQQYAQCRAACPQDAASLLGCTMKACNPSRGSCLKGCPTFSPD